MTSTSAPEKVPPRPRRTTATKSPRTVGSRAAKARNPQPRTAQRRQAILEAAMAIFAAHGYRNGSLGEIADQVGMTHAGVLHHFGTKERLLVEVLEYRDQADVEDLQDHHVPAGANLLKHLIWTAAQNQERPGIVQTYAVLSAEAVTDGHPAREWFRSRYTGLRTMLFDALKDTLPPDSAISDAEVGAATTAIIGMMDGLQVQWLLDPDAVDMPSAVELMIASVLARWGVEFQSDIVQAKFSLASELE